MPNQGDFSLCTVHTAKSIDQYECWREYFQFVFFFGKIAYETNQQRKERAKQSEELQNYRTMKSKIRMIYFCLSIKRGERMYEDKGTKIKALKTIIDAFSSKIVAFCFCLDSKIVQFFGYHEFCEKLLFFLNIFF